MTSIAGTPASYVEVVAWQDEGEQWHVTVDGANLRFGSDMSPEEAITTYLQGVAEDSPEGVARAHVEQGEQSLFLTVTADGKVTPSSVPEPEAFADPAGYEPDRLERAPMGAAEALLAQARAPQGQARFEDDRYEEEDDAPRRGFSGGLSGLMNRAGRESRESRGVRGSRGEGGWRRWLPLAGIVAAALVLIMVVAWVFMHWNSPGRSGVQMQTENVTLSQPPPAEWSSTPKWASPALLDSAGRVLVVNKSQVALVTADRHVVLVDAASGDTVWSAALPEGTVVPELTQTTIDGASVIALHVGDRLVWWKVDGGEAGGVDLPKGAPVSMQGTAPMIGLSTSSVGVVSGGKVATVQVPAGAIALAARADGTVTMGSSAGWWHVQAGQAPGKVTPWETGSTTPLTVTLIAAPCVPAADGAPQGCRSAYMASHIIAVASSDKGARVLVFSDRGQDVRFAFEGPMQMPAAASGQVTLQWMPSPSGAWGILSNTLVDLPTAQVRYLGEWTTKAIASDRALGTLGSETVVVGQPSPDRPSELEQGVLARGEGFPEDLVSLGGSAVGALMRADQDSSKIVFLLPPGSE